MQSIISPAPATLPVSKKSAEITIVNGGSSTIAHGVQDALNIKAWFICQNASDGYSVGDKLEMSGWCQVTTSRGVSWTKDDTNIYVLFASGSPVVPIKTSGVINAALPADWKLQLEWDGFE